MTIVTINRAPSWGDMAVGAVVNLPPALADPLLASGEAVPTPNATPTQGGPFSTTDGGGGIARLTVAQFAALEAADGLTADLEYFCYDGPARWKATGPDTKDAVVFVHDGVTYEGDQALAARTEVDLAAGTWATRPLTGFTADISYFRRMTDKGTLPGGRVMVWHGGVSTEWEAADLGAAYYGIITAAEMLALPVRLGSSCRVSNIGNRNPYYECDGTNWRPRGGRQLAFALAADTAANSTSGSYGLMDGCSCLFPAAALNFAGAGVLWDIGYDKSAGAVVPTFGVLFGANNTNADTVLSNPAPGASTRSGRLSGGWRRESATSIRVLGRGGATTDERMNGGTSNTARPSAQTVATLASATYLGVYVNMASSAESVSLHDCNIWVTG